MNENVSMTDNCACDENLFEMLKSELVFERFEN